MKGLSKAHWGIRHMGPMRKARYVATCCLNMNFGNTFAVQQAAIGGYATTLRFLVVTVAPVRLALGYQ